MRKPIVAALSVLTLPLAFGGYGCVKIAHAQPVAGTPAALQENPGADPFRDAREQGHRDGMHAGFDDMHRGMPPDPRRHHELRHPPVAHRFWDAYREGFRRGYDEAYHHHR